MATEKDTKRLGVRPQRARRGGLRPARGKENVKGKRPSCKMGGRGISSGERFLTLPHAASSIRYDEYGRLEKVCTSKKQKAALYEKAAFR